MLYTECKVERFVLTTVKLRLLLLLLKRVYQSVWESGLFCVKVRRGLEGAHWSARSTCRSAVCRRHHTVRSVLYVLRRLWEDDSRRSRQHVPDCQVTQAQTARPHRFTCKSRFTASVLCSAQILKRRQQPLVEEMHVRLKIRSMGREGAYMRWYSISIRSLFRRWWEKRL